MQNQNESIQNALRMAQTPAGQQLIRMLQQSGGEELQTAAQKAASGDYSQIKKLLSTLAENPDIQNIMDQFRR